MSHQTSSRLRVVMQMVLACAVGLLFWTCSSEPQQEEMLSYACQAPPAALAACSVDADCATVTIGCFCGTQPVNGVARKYSATAQSCEDTAASTCALGCATDTGLMTQDGNKAAAGTLLAARCDHASGTGTCKSYVPPPSGPGEPTTGW